MQWDELTIVTSCMNYSKYLPDWTDSIVNQTVKPRRVCLFTHGIHADYMAGKSAAMRLKSIGIDTLHEHSTDPLHFGVARNRAVAMADTEWVLHLDADDTLMRYAIAMFSGLAQHADVISAGYERTGRVPMGMQKKARVYNNAEGVLALDLHAICSSNSPFRKSFWERAPYRTDMFGAWDTALWIGFAHLGARFVATPQPVFHYRQHEDSIFWKRQKTMSWGRVHTSAMLKALRRNYDGVSIIVPRDYHITTDRQRNWDRVRAHYQHHHPTWSIVEGKCPSATWCKSNAIADALGHTNAAILVIADADCIVDPEALDAAVCAVRTGAAWAMPHMMVNRLTEQSTALILPDIPHDYFGIKGHALDRERYEGAPGGGIVVVRRTDYEAFGGIPSAFQGWGSEDRALSLLCETCVGPCERGSAELIHLYHHPQPKTRLTQINVQLLQRLGQAAQRGRDSLMIALSTLPKEGKQVLQIPRPKATEPLDRLALEQRQSFIGKQRRRMP